MCQKEKIIVIGGGGHAKVIISILKKLGKYEIIGFTDIEVKKPILGISFLGSDEALSGYCNKGIKQAVIGLGQIKSSEFRKKAVKKISDIGFEFPAIISPDSIINEDVCIGQGTVIMDRVTINSGTRVGSFSIINTNASIDHDCVIGNYTHIAPGAILSGEVKIGNDVLIGTGTSIIQSIEIPDSCIISAGSSVQKTIFEQGIYRGVPAEFIRKFE
jgi:sugar O-acyltransferase (sialic acid O-acetyltransferase NeuD family)